MNVARYLIRFLHAQGIEILFGIPGALNSILYDELQAATNPGLRHLLARHELGAGWMADGYGRARGDVGVFATVPGPGATHACSAVAGATADCSRLLAVTSGTPTTLRGRSRRDLFHGLDAERLFAGVTVWNERLRSPHELPGLLQSAFRRLRSGRPGAAHLEIPSDLWGVSLEAAGDPEFVHSAARPPDSASVLRAGRLLQSARRPVILAGSGVGHEQAGSILCEFGEKFRAPIITTAMGKGCLDERHAWSLGDSNSQSGAAAYKEHDLLISVGARFTQIDTRWNWFFPPRGLIQIDADERVLGAVYEPDVSVHGSIVRSLQALPEQFDRGLSTWDERIQPLRDLRDSAPRDPILEAIGRAAGPDAQIAVDVSMSGFYARRDWRVQAPGRYFYPGVYVGMGFALPAGIGAALARPDLPAVVLTGDGCFQMTMQELGVLAQEKLPLVVVLINDGGYEQIRRVQERLHEGRLTEVELVNPDFTALARSYGIRAECITDPARLECSVRNALGACSPYLIEFRLPGRYEFSG